MIPGPVVCADNSLLQCFAQVLRECFLAGRVRDLFRSWFPVQTACLRMCLCALCSVDPSNADYAVVTGVQIHNWGAEFDDSSPNLEFVAPASVYVVVGGERTYLDLSSIPVWLRSFPTAD